MKYQVIVFGPGGLAVKYLPVKVPGTIPGREQSIDKPFMNIIIDGFHREILYHE